VSDEPIRLALSHDEALVLFELLSRFSDSDQLTVEGKAEALALLRLLAQLEKLLVTPFSPDYNEWLEQARERLRVQAGNA